MAFYQNQLALQIAGFLINEKKVASNWLTRQIISDVGPASQWFSLVVKREK